MKEDNKLDIVRKAQQTFVNLSNSNPLFFQ